MIEAHRAQNEAAFQTAVRGLAGQGWARAMQEGSTRCSYRNKAGQRCAVGHCLSDEYLNELSDPCSQVGLASSVASLDPKQLPTPDVKFLRHMQVRHDCSATPEEMRDAFAIFGREQGFDSMPELEA